MLRRLVMNLRWRYFILRGMDIDKTAKVSPYARLDHTYSKGIHIGKYSFVGGGSLILTHDYTRLKRYDTCIGEYCFIGMDAIILPGIHIGDHSIVGAGAVVTKDVPPHTIVAGNPARVIREGINTAKWGSLVK